MRSKKEKKKKEITAAKYKASNYCQRPNNISQCNNNNSTRVSPFWNWQCSRYLQLL